MTWFYVDEKTIAHSTGTAIELLQGTWTFPQGIDSRSNPNLSAVKSAELVVAGLKFAKSHPYAKDQAPSQNDIELCQMANPRALLAV